MLPFPPLDFIASRLSDRSVAIGAAGFMLLAAGSASAGPVKATSADSFLNSLGINIHIDQGVEPASYVEPLKYLGIRQVRNGARHVDGSVLVAQKTGVHFTIFGTGDLKAIIYAAERLAKAKALLAIEGPNEPNNFSITYNGNKGGGPGGSWKAVGQFQADLYAAVKANPILKGYPVFGTSETGAQTDNIGLQFLTIPPGAETLFPAGTRFADYANTHNYVSGNGGLYEDNQAWNAADPTLNGRWDGLFGNNGTTWHKGFAGYDAAKLENLPRVTTETGWDTVSNPGGEHTQGANLTNTYLAQFKRGWSYTFIYQLRDGEGGDGNQGIFIGDTPKRAASYIHNLTTILADNKPLATAGWLDYAIPEPAATTHDLLLQKSSGEFELVVWGEKKTGSQKIRVEFAKPHARINVYDITVGSTPIRTLTNATAVELPLSDHAVVLEVTD
jgi:hypothetical protein